MRLVRIRASNEDELDCLLRELVAYSPRRSRRSVLVELNGESQTDLLALLSSLEACLEVNAIRSVRLEVDGQNYMLASE